MKRLLRAFLLASLLASGCFAQTITGAITGTVTDPSGAAIPQVKITASNTATNVATTSETNQSGLYNLLFLPVGQYTVTAEAQGFKKSILGPFTLELNQTARVDVALQVGQLTESVEVTGVAPILQTESTQTGDTIDAQKLTQIPLNGRNAVSEILFLPGTIQTNPASVNSADRLGARMFVNGNREQTNNFMLDGVDVNDSMDNRIGYLPSVDAMEEMKVLTGNAPAEFGNSAGAIVNMTIKSGTNQIHGDVFEFLRNDKLDANGFFGNRSGAKKRAFRQNIFGGTVGGPIVRNKAFFFADYEGTRRRDSGTALGTVAPAAFRTGNLSLLPQPIKDPTLGLPCTTADRRGCFPGNIIPASRIVNPVAKALFASPSLYPTANNPGVGTLGYTNNYTGTSANRLNNDQGDAKLDYRAGDKNSFSFRYSQGAYLTGVGQVLLPTSVGGLTEAPTKGASFTWTRTLSATLVNEARLGFTRTVIMDDFADLAGQLGPSGNNKLGIPGSQPTAGASAVTLGEGLSQIGTAGVLSDGKDNKYQFSENLTWQRGRHLLKMGANGVRYQQNRFYSGNNGGLGSFGYSGDYTGSAYADFLLDLLRSKGRGQADRRRWGQRHWRSGIFFQDDFKVRPNLTVNLGLRWEYEQPLYEVNDFQANIDKVTGQINLAGKNGNSRALYNSYYKQFMPRVGIAWTPGMFNNRLAVRAGYGITSFLEGTGVNLRLPLNPPFFFESNVNYGDSNPGTIRTGFSDITIFTGQLAGNIRIWDPNLRPQFTQQMNLSLEYQLTNSMSLNAGYVGQRAKHTIVARDTNQPLPGVGPESTWTPIQQRRPLFPYVPGVTTTATTESTGTMTYDSLQVSLRKRFSAGLDFQASYTLSKTINDALGFFGAGATDSEGAYWQNAYDRKSNRGPAAWDALHNFNLGGSYQVPFGTGRQLGSHMNRAVDLVLGGWNAGYSASARSGLPITISGFDQTNQSPRGTQRPNRLRAFTYQGQSVDRWFGTDNITLCPVGTDDGKCAYQNPTRGNFGNSGIGTERGPSFFVLNTSLGKDFHVSERNYFQFRMEAFNVLNHVSFNVPARGFTSPGTFGAITSQATPPRNIQFALKYYF